MPDTPETLPLRMARMLAGALPKGRSAFVKSIARAAGAPHPFYAQVDGLKWLIDLKERVSRTRYVYGDFAPMLTRLLMALLPPGGSRGSVEVPGAARRHRGAHGPESARAVLDCE
jgi:hypothetical protein